MCSNKEKGYVYILTNESFRDCLILIGASSKPLDDLIDNLDNGDLPTPYNPFATMHTEKYEMVAELIHRQIDRFTYKRIEQGKNFFVLSPSDALEILMDFAALMDDATVLTYDDGETSQVYPFMNPSPGQIEESSGQE